MKILLVGEYLWPWYHEACAEALEDLGCQVVGFGWFDRFKKWLAGKSAPVYRSFVHRVQFRFLGGPIVRKINKDLVRTAVANKPDVIWFYNAQLVYPETVRTLRKKLPAAVFCQYANDNPFSSLARKALWRHFIGSIPLMDINYAFRIDNIKDFYKHGSKQVHLLRAYFIPGIDYPVNADEIDPRFRCDVVFAGHYEDDGRIEALEAVCRAGYKLNLFGGGWERVLSKLDADSPLRALYSIRPVTGLDYNRAICGAKVALSFLSTLNRDTYTRRSFQIPAMKTVMLSQHTDDLSGLFTEGEEAVFFSNIAELLDKLRYLLADDAARRRIAENGYSRVYRDGQDVVSRMRQWLDTVRAYRKKISLHFIQDIPTPHNNVLLKALQKDPAIDLRVWYAQPAHPQYSFSTQLAHEVKDPVIYGSRWPSWRLIRTALFNKEDKFFVVGWMNPTTRLLVPLCWISRRPYNIWFDQPSQKQSSRLKNFVRNLYCFLLKNSNARVFVVGKNAVSYFKDRGFPDDRIVNLPIFVEINENIEEYRKHRTEIRAKYSVGNEDLFIVTGGRLVYEKGIDLLIRAIMQLDGYTKSKIKLLLIGKGAEKPALSRLVSENRLERLVYFEEWMGHREFMAHLGAADLAVHPARFDAYGGVTLSAMAAGIPVVASKQAGSAADRIEHSVNGWLYDCDDTFKLAYWLTKAFQDRNALKAMGLSARRTAEKYSPDAGADIIVRESV